VLTGNPNVSLPVIAVLLVTCFAALTAYCLIVAWPKLRWSLQTIRHPGRQRPQYRAEHPRDRLRDIRPTTRRTLLK